MRAYLPLLAIAVLLTACDGRLATAPATITPAPSAVVPTRSPSPLGPAVPATAQPSVGLPAPLYILEAGQIARIERDARTRHVITQEFVNIPDVEAIAEFAVASTGNLAYIVGDKEADRLVLTDAQGQHPRKLYEQQSHELSNLLFTPDGQALVLHLLNNRTPPDRPSGLYRLALAGGELELLRADDTPDDPVNPARSVSGYRPVAFSPDGTRLLLQVYSLFYGETCGVGAIAATGGDVTRVNLPEGFSGYCGEEAWSADGKSLLFLAGKAQGDEAGPQLWRADAATGTAAPLLTAGNFARQPYGSASGIVRFLLAHLVRNGSEITGASFVPAQLDALGTEPTALDAAFSEQIHHVLWAADGRGLVVEGSKANERSTLHWLSLHGPAVELPNADAALTQMAWGVE